MEGVYSDKLADRGYVHSPTKIPGQKPITVGHQYSTVVYLPEKTESLESHWVIPLAIDHYSAKGKLYHIKIERWYDRLEKGHANLVKQE